MRWILLFDDGETPIIHVRVIEADNLRAALDIWRDEGNSDYAVWAACLEGHEATAAGVLPRSAYYAAT